MFCAPGSLSAFTQRNLIHCWRVCRRAFKVQSSSRSPLCSPLSNFFTPAANAQQTLGAIVGTVTDATGSVVPGCHHHRRRRRNEPHPHHAVQLVAGSYALQNLPIGSYSVTISARRLHLREVPGHQHPGDRTVTLPATPSLSVPPTRASPSKPRLCSTPSTPPTATSSIRPRSRPSRSPPEASHRPRHPLARRQRRTLPSGTGALSPASATRPSGPTASATRQQLLAQRCRRLEPVQRQVHLECRLRPRRQLDRRLLEHRRRRRHPVLRLDLSLHRQCHPHARALRPSRRFTSTPPCTTPSRVRPPALTST